jgi:site-specific recombinase XerD
MINRLEEYKEYLKNIGKSLVYYNYLISLIKYLEKNNIDFYKLTKDQLANYFKEKKYKPNSINSLLNACRDFCRYKNITVHSCFEIKSVEVPERLPEYITLEEIGKVIKHIVTYNSRLSSDKVDVLLHFMFYTGVRKSEILNLKRESFDLVNCTIKIYEEKTKQEKIIPFPNSLIKKITDYFNGNPEENNAFNVTLSQINYLFGGVMTEILGRKIKPHLSRHGGGRYLLEKGVPITVVQKILGHTNISTTLRYLNPDQKMIDRTYRDKIK